MKLLPRRLTLVLLSSIFALIPVASISTKAHAAPPSNSFSFGWQPSTLVGAGDFNTMNGVSCVSATVCFAIGVTPTGSNAFYASYDAGATWYLQIGPFAPTEVYTAIKCTDTRHCWISTAALTLNFANESSSVFLLDPSRGISNKLTIPQDAATGFLGNITCVSNTTCWAVGNTIISTTNGGNTWSDQNLPAVGTPYELRSVSFSDALHGVAVAGSNVILHTQNGGATWLATSVNGALWSSVSCSTATECWAVGEQSLNSYAGLTMHSSDGGATWTEQSIPSGFIPTSITCSVASGRSFCRIAGLTTAGAAVLASPNGGISWQSQAVPSTVTGFGASLTGISCYDSSVCVAVGVHPNHSGAIIQATDGALRTADQECADVAMLTVRGSDEKFGQDTEVDNTALYLASSLPLSTTFKVRQTPYAAVKIDLNNLLALTDSVSQGIVIVKNEVRSLVSACPHEQIVLIGFSQGAGVIDETLGFLQNEKVTGTKHVLADWVTHVTLLADPLRMAGRRIDASAIPSVWPPNEPELSISNEAKWEAENGLQPFALGDTYGEQIPAAFTKPDHGWTRAVSWCIPGDWICEAPGVGIDLSNLTLHGLYTDESIQIGVATAARGHVINALSQFRRGL